MLQYLGGGVEVERDVGDHVVVVGQTVHSVVDQHRLAGTSGADQHHRSLALQQQVDEVSNPRRLGRVYKRRLQHDATEIS